MAVELKARHHDKSDGTDDGARGRSGTGCGTPPPGWHGKHRVCSGYQRQPTAMVWVSAAMSQLHRHRNCARERLSWRLLKLADRGGRRKGQVGKVNK